MRQQLLKRPLHYRTTIQNLLIVYFPNQDNFNAACFMTKPILWKLYVKLDCRVPSQGAEEMSTL
jgi:hypothetical protein